MSYFLLIGGAALMGVVVTAPLPYATRWQSFVVFVVGAAMEALAVLS